MNTFLTTQTKARLPINCIFTKRLMAAILSLVPAVVAAANMEPIPAGHEHCAGERKDGAYCYEWRLTADSSVRIVSVGYEDGGSVDIYRIDQSGSYRHISKVYPVLREKGDADFLYWGYSWDIKDVAISMEGGEVNFFGAFRHRFIEDGVDVPVDRKTPIPIVLFLGKTSQPSIHSPRVPLRKLSLVELVENERG